MQQHGIRADQVMQVRGFADQRLRKPDAPLDPSNRRVSFIVKYQQKNDSANPDSKQAPGAEKIAGALKAAIPVPAKE
jgi:chemotaxis protein MotB